MFVVLTFSFFYLTLLFQEGAHVEIQDAEPAEQWFVKQGDRRAVDPCLVKKIRRRLEGGIRQESDIVSELRQAAFPGNVVSTLLCKKIMEEEGKGSKFGNPRFQICWPKCRKTQLLSAVQNPAATKLLLTGTSSFLPCLCRLR